jgi:hypothetical protein
MSAYSPLEHELLSLYAQDAEREVRIETDKKYDVSYIGGLEPQQLRSNSVTVNVNMPMLRVDQAAIVMDPAQFKVVRCGRL